jgi:hypothetical protein
MLESSLIFSAGLTSAGCIFSEEKLPSRLRLSYATGTKPLLNIEGLRLLVLFEVFRTGRLKPCGFCKASLKLPGTAKALRDAPRGEEPCC